MLDAEPTSTQVQLPEKLIPIFSGKARFRGAYGGRGSGKSFSFAKMTAVFGYMHGKSGRSGQILCAREFMNSLEDSALVDVKKAIASEPFLAAYYEVGEKFVRSRDGRIRYVFSGLTRNIDSIKSKADVLVCWVDEAEGVSETAWRKLRPTIRESGSEVWVTWNPESPESATHKRYRESPPENAKIVEINWRDNHWWTDELEQERRDELKNRPDTYEHVYEGDFLSQTEVQVFYNKWCVEDFTPKPHWDGPYHAIDFGFRPDPLCALKVWVGDGKIWIEREAYGSGVEIDATTKFICDAIPGFENHVSRADSAEPKTISYLKRHGLPRIEPVKKWPNSVEEGVRWLRGYDKIVIHPRCTGSQRDFQRYSHKVDRLSGDILPDLVDADNHAPDTLRYALAPLIKAVKAAKTSAVAGMY